MKYKIKQFKRLALASLCLFLLTIPTTTAFAQSETSDSSGVGVILFWLLCCGGILVINGLMLLWVWSDANNRGSNGVAWSIIVFIFGILGLLAYLVMRPQGQLLNCPECGKKKPITQPICPHCGKRVV